MIIPLFLLYFPIALLYFSINYHLYLMIIFPAFTLLSIFWWPSIKALTEFQSHSIDSDITGLHFPVSNSGNIVLLKFSIKLFLYSFDLVFRVVVMSWIRFMSSAPRFNSVLAPDSNPYKTQRPSFSRRLIVLFTLLAPTQSKTAVNLFPSIALIS